jgi:hypothetical protein
MKKPEHANDYDCKHVNMNELSLYWIALSVLKCSAQRSSKDHLLFDAVLLQEET